MARSHDLGLGSLATARVPVGDGGSADPELLMSIIVHIPRAAEAGGLSDVVSLATARSVAAVHLAAPVAHANVDHTVDVDDPLRVLLEWWREPDGLGRATVM